MVSLTLTCHASDKVLLAAEDSWPPYSGPNGQGISQQTIVEAYHAVNVEVDFVVVPYARALQMVKSGEVDGAFNVTKQHSTVEQFRFGREPLIKAQASFYYSPISALQLNSINDAPDGTVIALILGYEYGELYELNRHRFKEIRVSNQQQIINLLRKNRVDLAIMFDRVAAYYIQQMELPEHSIRQGNTNHISDIYVAFNKDKPSLPPLIDKLDQGLRLIRTLTPP